MNEKLSGNKNVKISDNLTCDIANEVKKLTKAGIIKIVYAQHFSDWADDIKREISKGGYNVDLLPYEENLSFEEFAENSEGILLLGVSLADKFCGKKCIIVAENIDLLDLLHKDFYSILIDKSQIKFSPFDLMASEYGKLMTRLVACFDFKLAAICYNKSDDLQIVEQIENEIVKLFLKNYIYYRDEKFIFDLLDCILKVGELECKLSDTNLLTGYDITCKMVQKSAKSKKLAGEYAMLVGWFAVNTIKSLHEFNSSDLFAPCDVVEDINFVANKLDISKTELLKIADKITAKEYTRFNLVIAEYHNEIGGYIDKIYPACANAMKNYRRIYYDVGLEISTSISIESLAECVFRTAIFNPRYGYIKTKRVLGSV